LRAKILWEVGVLAAWQGDRAAARRYLTEVLSLARDAGDDAMVAHVLFGFAQESLGDGDLAAAEAHLEEGLAVARQTTDRWIMSALLIALGDLARVRGDDARANARYEDSLAVHGDPHWSLRNLGYIALHAGDVPRALERIRGALAFCREVGYTRGQAECLISLAGVAVAHGLPLVAARLLGALDGTLRRVTGGSLVAGDRFEYERTKTRVREILGDAAFASASTEGDRLTLEQAIASGLEGADA
jgi:hypothetical protein